MFPNYWLCQIISSCTGNARINTRVAEGSIKMFVSEPPGAVYKSFKIIINLFS